MKKVVNNCKKRIIHLLIHFFSFTINYFMFLILMIIFYNINDVVNVQIFNLISWIISMLFIFYVDKKYVPDLVDENNSSELFKFFLIRVIGLITESLILFIFVSIFKYNYCFLKLISLLLLFIINAYYVKYVKFKQ